jgi:hypothetical protein
LVPGRSSAAPLKFGPSKTLRFSIKMAQPIAPLGSIAATFGCTWPVSAPASELEPKSKPDRGGSVPRAAAAAVEGERQRGAVVLSSE